MGYLDFVPTKKKFNGKDYALYGVVASPDSPKVTRLLRKQGHKIRLYRFQVAGYKKTVIYTRQ